MDTPTRRQFAAGAAALSVAGCGGAIETPVPEAQFTTVAGRRLHHVVDGDGPPLILLHGASGNLRDWTFSLFDRLTRRYRVLAVDRPGLGLSDPAPIPDSLFSQADMIHDGARALGFGKATVVGHSYGGSVALAYALSYPESVRSLILVSAPSMVWPGGLDPLYSIANTPVLGRIFSNLVPFVATERRIDRAIAGIFAPQPVPPGYVAHMRPELALRPEAYRRNAAQVGALKETLRTMEPRYPGLSVPVEVIHGSADTIVGSAIHSEPLARILPEARLTLLDGVGHMPHHSHQQVLLDALSRVAG